jgi:hypothetical protein
MKKRDRHLLGWSFAAFLMTSPLEAQQPPAEYIAADREFAIARPNSYDWAL